MLIPFIVKGILRTKGSTQSREQLSKAAAS